VAASESVKPVTDYAAAHGADVSSAVQSIMANTDLGTVETTIENFAGSSETLMKALDAIQTIHPFVGGVFPVVSFHLASP
jgi:hypothetical protein